MSVTNNSNVPAWTNPLQNNNAAMMVVAYVAGIAAAKLPWFDLNTWNYIIFTAGGAIFAGVSYLINTKKNVITTTANLPEVKNEGGIVLDKTVAGTAALVAATPDNVVLK